MLSGACRSASICASAEREIRSFLNAQDLGSVVKRRAALQRALTPSIGARTIANRAFTVPSRLEDPVSPGSTATRPIRSRRMPAVKRKTVCSRSSLL